MKKSILTVAILLGSLSTFAQTTTAETTTAQTATTAKTEEVAKTAGETSAQTGAAVKTEQATQEEFKEIKAEEVPAPVNEALKKAFPTAILEKAYINEKKEYKLEVKVGEKTGALYADATGKWIKK